MHRDIKIGLILGLVLVIIVMLRISTDPRLSPEARIEQLHKTAPRENSISENNIISESLSAFEQEPEADIPEVIEPTTEYAGDSDITAIEQIQEKLATEVSDSSKYEQTEKIQTRKFHIVQKDETLSGISQKYYGSANKWKQIYNFNRNVIKDPNRISSGTKLIIPDL